MVTQFSLVYWTSENSRVIKVQEILTGFKLALDGSTSTWYYLSIKSIVLDQPSRPLPVGMYPFYLAKPPASNTAFWSTWAAKGVNSAAPIRTWQKEMWKIINGSEPMFYLRVSGGRPMLVDALQKWQWEHTESSGLTGPYNPLRIGGDYPIGSYTFTCNLAPLNGVAMKITFKSFTWSKTFGGTGDDVGYCVAKTSDGGYAIAGSTNSSGAGGTDIYLIKTDASGNMLWSETYGGSGWDEGRSVVQTSDGGYAIAGSTSYVSPTTGVNCTDVCLVKTDSKGNLQFPIKTLGGIATEGGTGYSIVQTSDGGYAIAGSQDFRVVGHHTGAYLVKTDASGNIQWSKRWGAFDVGYCVVQAADGGYVITGSRVIPVSSGPGCELLLIKTDASGNTLWEKTYGGAGYDSARSVVQTSDGGYVVAGSTNSSGAGGTDIYLIKTDASGNMLWSKTYGGTGDDEGFSVVRTDDGGYAIAGSTRSFGAGGTDIYLIKTDASGSKLWKKTFGGTKDDIGYSVVQVADVGYVIVGSTKSFGAGGTDIYLIKTNG